jgi:hypothetical protein
MTIIMENEELLGTEEIHINKQLYKYFFIVNHTILCGSLNKKKLFINKQCLHIHICTILHNKNKDLFIARLELHRHGK